MHRSTITRGLNLVTIGVATITLSTFFPARIAQILFFSAISASEMVFFGLFSGGIVCGAGIMLTVAGVLRNRSGREVRILPSLIMLAVTTLLFFTLFYLSFSTPKTPPLRPGETVTI